MDHSIVDYRARIGLFVGVLLKILKRKAHIAANRIKGLRMRNCASMLSVFTLLLMLLMAGVEPNPGPGVNDYHNIDDGGGENHTNDKFDRLCSAVNDLSRKIGGLANRVGDLEHTNSNMGVNIGLKLEAMERAITTRVTQLEHDQNVLQLDVDAMDEKCCKLESEADTLKQQVASMDTKLLHMETEARRRNLVFFGVPRMVDESWSMCEEKVKTIIARDLKLRGTFLIDRARRVGSAILVTFQSLKQRDEVLSHSRELAAIKSPVFIREDFPEKIRQRRAGLAPLMKQLREDGKKATLKNDKLITDNATYAFDLETQQFTKHSPRNKRQQNSNTHSNKQSSNHMDDTRENAHANDRRRDGADANRGHAKGGGGTAYRDVLTGARTTWSDSTRHKEVQSPPHKHKDGRRTESATQQSQNSGGLLSADNPASSSSSREDNTSMRGVASGRTRQRGRGIGRGSPISNLTSPGCRSPVSPSRNQSNSPMYASPEPVEGALEDVPQNGRLSAIQAKLARFAYSGTTNRGEHNRSSERVPSVNNSNQDALRGFGRGSPLSRSSSVEENPWGSGSTASPWNDSNKMSSKKLTEQRPSVSGARGQFTPESTENQQHANRQETGRSYRR